MYDSGYQIKSGPRVLKQFSLCHLFPKTVIVANDKQDAMQSLIKKLRMSRISKKSRNSAPHISNYWQKQERFITKKIQMRTIHQFKDK